LHKVKVKVWYDKVRETEKRRTKKEKKERKGKREMK